MCDKENMKNSQLKGLLKFITCGSVDDGKSTLIGHILYDSKLLYADQEEALELDSKIGSRGGEIDYSLLLDGLSAEREQGITIDVAYRYFSTEKRSFIVADTPGHEEYTRNMAVGASFADLAIILVDASHGVLVQTRRHARICSLMGIEHFIFAVNKMDLLNYSENGFLEVKQQIQKVVDELNLKDVVVIPVSATEGDNVTKKSQNMNWYTGKTILEHLESVQTDEIDKSDSSSFYLCVQRVCRPNSEFRGFMGQIEKGSVKVGDEIVSLPSKERARIKKIIVGFDDVNYAQSGQAVNIVLDREVDVSRGCVLCSPQFSSRQNFHPSETLTSTILWMDDSVLERGKNFFVKIGTKMIPGIVTDIHYSIDVNTGSKNQIDSLKKNEIASVGISLTEPIVVDLFKTNRTLGELILIDRITNMTSACGVVDSVSPSSVYSDENSGKIDEKFQIDRSRRSLVKNQTPLVAEFVLGKNGVSYDFVSELEHKLFVQGRHTYVYTPLGDEDYVLTASHLYNAGLVVLLVLDERLQLDKHLQFGEHLQIDERTHKNDDRKKSIFWIENLQENFQNLSVNDAAEILLKKSAVNLDSDYSI